MTNAALKVIRARVPSLAIKTITIRGGILMTLKGDGQSATLSVTMRVDTHVVTIVGTVGLFFVVAPGKSGRKSNQAPERYDELQRYHGNERIG
jgi:hypothetical protein